VCRLTGDDLFKLSSVFTELAGKKGSDDNPVFRFETSAAAFSYNDFGIQSRRASQRDVRAIEMLARSAKAKARLYLDIEEGTTLFATVRQGSSAPVAVRSVLEVEGDEADVFPLWDELMSIARQRPSRTASLMNSGVEFAIFLGLTVVPMVLALYTIARLRITGTIQTNLTVLSAALALVFAVVTLNAVQILWPRISIEGWGRFERTRATIRNWGVVIVGGLVVWSLTLLGDRYLHR
jgi:hypothetical protein